MRNRVLLFAVLLLSVSCQKLARPTGNQLWCQASTESSFGTKGAEVTTNGLNTEGNVFIMDAWLEKTNRGATMPEWDQNPRYLDSKEMKLSGGYWKCDNCFWTNQIQTNFWAYYPKTATGRGTITWPGDSPSEITDAQEKTPYFVFDMTSYSGTKKNASEATPDLIFAYARESYNSETEVGGVLYFKFRHALSGLRFKRGHIDSGYNITEIKIGGLHLKDTCFLGGGTNADGDTLSFKWDGGIDTPDKTVGLTQTISATSVSEGEFITGSNMMFVIPQTMSSTTTIYAVITKTLDSSTETREVALTGYDWKPGKRYDYTLSYFKEKSEFTVTVSEYNISDGTWTD